MKTPKAPKPPTPHIPTPSIPTPPIPTPSIPTPSIPTPSIPTPSIPTPPTSLPNPVENAQKAAAVIPSEGSAKAFVTNAVSTLEQAGIELVEQAMSLEAAAYANPYQTKTVGSPDAEMLIWSLYWWGCDFNMNEKLTKKFVEGVGTAGEIEVAIVESAEPYGAAIAAGLKVAFILKKAEIELVDDGKGVHWPMTWPQWADLVAGAGAGGANGVQTAAMLHVHPLRN